MTPTLTTCPANLPRLSWATVDGATRLGAIVDTSGFGNRQRLAACRAQLYEYWTLASLTYLLPQLKPLGEILLDTVSSAGVGTLKFLVSVIIAGFLFSPGALLVAATKTLALRIDSTHGEEFVELSGATIRAVSRGVIGISLLQAVLGGIGMSLAGVPGTSLLTFAILYKTNGCRTTASRWKRRQSRDLAFSTFAPIRLLPL